ncbi:MAG TPA: selenide, water dikinase SelD [Cyclobacteriaceae bacterium]|nr:selenide, water dikinase SelD [Cyclobacteriaceae bacterium]
MQYKLTEYSHGAGCGCKLSPGVLTNILGSNGNVATFKNLLVGNETKDDAAVVDLDGETAIVSTTDFFMPIVDDPFDFGAIAATNAISDIYAMGAEPIVAIAILGWPIDKIPASVASTVLQGARSICASAGIPLAGGHSIDAPEPIFGLAVTGKAPIDHIKKNKDGKAGDILYLTKPLGIGIVTTAQKKKLADPKDLEVAKASMLKLNKIGQELGRLPYVNALTDVTGFGLGGHLIEVCEGSSTSAVIYEDQLPVFDFVEKYISLNCIPGGTTRNWKTYGHQIALKQRQSHHIVADPQTSGGLLVSVDKANSQEFEKFMLTRGFDLKPIGALIEQGSAVVISII